MTMWIEKIKPELVGGKSTLPDCLAAEGVSRGWAAAETAALMALLPPALSACACFLDKLTGIWRYEFGRPHTVGNELLWGTHMWPPVPVLFEVLACARLRLPPEKLAAYLTLLTDADKQQEYLAEMFPLLRVNSSIPANHEAGGRGAGNTTVDWAIGPVNGRSVLLDVKRRFADFIAQMSMPAEGSVPAPEHDPALLFRSVEKKYLPADPDAVLQGAWIVTDIKQEAGELDSAFAGLDAGKVHFAVLGDHRPDIHLLVRREQDRAFLLDLFRTAKSDRFVFTGRQGTTDAASHQARSRAAAACHGNTPVFRRR